MKRKILTMILAMSVSMLTLTNTCYASSGYGGFIVDWEAEEGKYTSGMYKVGVDMPAGEYILYANSGAGYFCVSTDSNADDIIFNDNFDYNSIVTVRDGEYLDLSRCYAVPFDEAEEISTDVTGSMYKVGEHIPAGEYKLDAGYDMGYYCIYSDSRHDYIIANDNFEGQSYVTVSDGQYLLLSRCYFTNPPVPMEKVYSDSETIKLVQEALNNAGYDCGVADGIAGTKTTDAIKKYQTDNALSVNGIITDELLEMLTQESSEDDSQETSDVECVEYFFNFADFSVPDYFIDTDYDSDEMMMFEHQDNEGNRIGIIVEEIPDFMKIDTGSGDALITEEDTAKYFIHSMEDETIEAGWKKAGNTSYYEKVFTSTNEDGSIKYGRSIAIPIDVNERGIAIHAVCDDEKFLSDVDIILESLKCDGISLIGETNKENTVAEIGIPIDIFVERYNEVVDFYNEFAAEDASKEMAYITKEMATSSDDFCPDGELYFSINPNTSHKEIVGIINAYVEDASSIDDMIATGEIMALFCAFDTSLSEEDALEMFEKVAEEGSVEQNGIVYDNYSFGGMIAIKAQYDGFEIIEDK